ncbi:mitomycin resistance protein [candidate division GN15 bacterium]|nr:mitomycin resistance protein [candidate division GN15 bacterium]
MAERRRLTDLYSVGKAIAADLERLGITEVAQLVGCDAREMHARLEKLTGKRVDPCVQDTFAAAIAQAENPDLPEEQRRWWYWSRVRKAR